MQNSIITDKHTSATGREFEVKRYESACGIPVDISVVVPIYGAEHTLKQALNSLCTQSGVSLEIVCVDDCSPDNSRKIIENFFAKDPRITVVSHTKNAGYGASMNDGITAAQGKWLAILEPDDYILPGMYEEMLAAAWRFQEQIDIVKTPYIREVREEGTQRGEHPAALYNCSYHKRVRPARQPFNIKDKSASHLLRHHPSIWSAIYHRQFLIDENISFVEYPGSGWADNEFFYETLLAARNIVYVDHAFYVYREETNSEFDAFARSNKSLPFNRWHSMGDITSRRGYDACESVMRSHVSKGFTYLGGQLSANETDGQPDKVVEDEMVKMFERMEPSLVDAEPKISPALKQRYWQWYDSTHKESYSHKGNFSYYMGLVGELVYAVSNNGLGFALSQVQKVLSRKNQ